VNTLPTGVHRGIPAPRYHAIQAASASQLRTLHNGTPAHVAHKARTPFIPTWETILGELIHHAILEPSRPFPQLAVVPETYPIPEGSTLIKKGGKQVGDPADWSWSANFCKAWKAEQEQAGRIVVKASDLDEINLAVECVWANPWAREIMEGAHSEVTLIWDDADAFPCKARLDLVPQGALLADLKTCGDASESGFERHAWDMGYHIQAAWYLIGWDVCGEGVRDEFRFIAYERGVGLVKVHRVSDTLLEIGKAQAMDAFHKFKASSLSGEWGGYDGGVAEMNVPKWARKEVGL
jgi:hypothetical protein